MDNLTHTLVGISLVRAGIGRGVAGATAAMVIASNAPDSDIISAFAGGRVAYLAAHRGWTHGVVGMTLLAVAIWIGVLAWRRFSARAPALTGRDALALAGVCAIGTALHVLMDLPTSYGTRVLSPFESTWFAVDWMPIIDIYIWLVLLGGIAVPWLRPRWKTSAARTALALVVGLYALRGVAHDRALELAATRNAEGEVAPCATAERLAEYPALIESASAGPGACIQAAAIPTFFSPFKWRLVRQHPGGYELREHSLLTGQSPVGGVWIPSEVDRWVAAARRTETVRVFLRFARFHASRYAMLEDGTRRVRFMDVRFVGNPLQLTDDPEAHAPFVATVLLSPDGRVVAERLGP